MSSQFYAQWKSNIGQALIKSVTIRTGGYQNYPSTMGEVWKKLEAQETIISAIYQYYLHKINSLLLQSEYNRQIHLLIYSYLDATHKK